MLTVILNLKCLTNSDKDGVRDDVEIWINYELDTPMKRMALKAMAHDDYLFINTEDISENNLRKIRNASSIAGDCFAHQFLPDDIYTHPAPAKNSLFYASGIEYLVSSSTDSRLQIYTSRGTKISGTPGLQGYERLNKFTDCALIDERYNPVEFSKKAEETYQNRLKNKGVENERK
jgi:hypothetical protein